MALRAVGAGNYMRKMLYADAPASVAVSSVLLMHFDGTNGSTTFTDFYGTAMTGTAGASISTAQSKFGGASATGTASAAICTANSTSLTLWDFLTGDFTIEAWVNPGASNRNGVFSTTSTKGPALSVFGTTVFFGSGTTNFSRTITALTANTFAALAWVRKSGVATIYLNGTQVGTTQADTQSYQPSLNAPFTTQIGYDSQLSGVGTAGFIDELRISNVARYTTNYTPATSAFTS